MPWYKTNCIELLGNRTRQGYIHKSIKGKSYYMHRVVYSNIWGSIPRGYVVCHHCDNPSCINPNHLFLGTQKDNVHDAIEKKRYTHFSSKGEKHFKTKLRNKDVRWIKSNYIQGSLTYGARPLARKFDVHPRTIHRIVNEKTWTHIEDGCHAG
jgi:hypothetical protein